MLITALGLFPSAQVINMRSLVSECLLSSSSSTLCSCNLPSASLTIVTPPSTINFRASILACACCTCRSAWDISGWYENSINSIRKISAPATVHFACSSFRIHLPGINPIGSTTNHQSVIQQGRIIRVVRHVGESGHDTFEHFEALIADVASEVVHIEQSGQWVRDFVSYNGRYAQWRAKFVWDI